MESLRQDLLHAMRLLSKSPGFTLIAVFTLALGIGAGTAIFSVVDGVLLRPLPYPEPDRLVRVWQVGGDGGRMNFSHPNFEDVRTGSGSFAELAEYATWPAPVVAGDEPERVMAAQVSPGFFRTIGVDPAVGRSFAPEEASSGAAVALISDAFWQRRLAGRDPTGTTVRVGGRSLAIVGVMPPGFGFPQDAELWMPQELGPRPHRTAHNWRVIGRLRPDVSIAAAEQEVRAIARRLKQQYGDDTWMSDAAVASLHDDVVGGVRFGLLLLLGASGFLLLVACANVANLLLARLVTRRRELAVRTALGARRMRLVQQLLAESLVLSIAGALVGVLVAGWGVHALLALDPGRLPRAAEVGLDWRAFSFALAVAVVTAGVLALFTTTRPPDANLREALSDGQRTFTGGVASQRLRGALVSGQVALTLVLLLGAGLLGRSFLRVLAVEAGYRMDGGIIMSLDLPYPEDEAGRARLLSLHESLLDRLRALPGVEVAGGVDVFPLSGGGANGMFIAMTRPDEIRSFDDARALLQRDTTRIGYAEYRIATKDYFHAMGIPLVSGRLFDERDHPDAPHVAVISESLARAEWGEADPIGRYVQFGNMDGDVRPYTIVGVVGDVRERSLEEEPVPTFYGNAAQRGASLGGTYSIVLDGPAQAAVVAPAARQAVRDIAPDVPVRFRTRDEIFSGAMGPRRFSLLLLGVFAASALLLAIMGVYGLVAFLVEQRSREIGIRIALGARRASVLGLVMRQGALLAAAGIVAGLLISTAAVRLLGSVVYGIDAVDPLTFAAASVLLGFVVLAATLVPARRATRVDPTTALRRG